eukprot:TRINITY_DN23680_c0_g1_i1.p1 TRINITY_DN23680_c0_g1~~TRINITY_DN23680_c0_g1_i1.p1  ORF type:complete len:572 (+),score=113.72 TRINITY_DN23680_c0_g1_i1:116-1831(+)
MYLLKFVWILFFIVGSSGTYSDGNFNVADVYNDVIYKTNAYSVYRLPDGIVYFDLLADPNSNTFWALLDHTPCPRAQNCDNSAVRSMMAQFAPANMAVRALQPFSRATYGRPAPPLVFKAVSIMGYTYVLTDGQPMGKLLKLSTATGGQVAGVWPADRALSYIASGVIDQANATAYLLAYNVVAIYAVDLNTMSLIRTIDISSRGLPRTADMSLAFDATSQRLYVLGVINNTRWDIIQVTTAGTVLPQSDLIGQLGLNTTWKVGMFVKHEYSLYMALQAPTSGYVSDVTTQYVQIVNPASMAPDVIAPPAMVSRRQTDYFFDDQQGYLYTVNAGSQITRFQFDVLKYDAIMTIVLDNVNDIHIYQPGVMPPLLSGMLFQSGTTAYIGTDWWGNIIRLDLQNFCDDDTCWHPNNGQKGGSAVFPVGTLVGVVILFCTLVVIIVVFVIIRYRLRRRLRLEAAAKRGGYDRVMMLDYVHQPAGQDQAVPSAFSQHRVAFYPGPVAPMPALLAPNYGFPPVSVQPGSDDAANSSAPVEQTMGIIIGYPPVAYNRAIGAVGTANVDANAPADQQTV